MYIEIKCKIVLFFFLLCCLPCFMKLKMILQCAWSDRLKARLLFGGSLLDFHGWCMSCHFLQSHRPGNLHPFCYKLEKVVSGLRLVIAVFLNVDA